MQKKKIIDVKECCNWLHRAFYSIAFDIVFTFCFKYFHHGDIGNRRITARMKVELAEAVGQPRGYRPSFQFSDLLGVTSIYFLGMDKFYNFILRA